MNLIKKIVIFVFSIIIIGDFSSCTVVAKGDSGYHRRPRRPRPPKTVIIIKEDRRHHHRNHRGR